MSTRSNPIRQIQVRQRQEELVATYHQIATDHTKAKMLGQWEEKTQRRIDQNGLHRAMDEIQARRGDVLVRRRERLALLLLTERTEHEHMVSTLAETDDERRERLMQKARELRQKREELRKEQSAQRRDQLFREESAIVREAQSRLKVLAVAAERARQLDDLQERRRREGAENQFFAEQFLAQQRSQAQRAQSDLELIQRRNEQCQSDLAKQVQQLTQRRNDARAQQAADDEEFRRTHRANVETDTRKENERRQRQKDIAEEVKRHNETQRAERDGEAARLRREDEAELARLLASIAAEEAADRERKAASRADAMHQIKFVEAQMNAVAESETALDKLWQEEADKEWAKREHRWRQEQQRREALLRDVFETRRAQVHALRAQEAAEATRKKEEHETMVRDIRQLTREDRGHADSARAVAKDNQAYLAMQVAERQAERDAAREAKRGDMTDAQAAEFAYKDKIAHELAKLEAAKPEQYRGVKLNGSRRGLSGI